MHVVSSSAVCKINIAMGITQFFLQNFGKVDRTADDIFDEHLQNFTRQQNAANRLQKEFNNYIRCIRAVQTASKTLMDSLNEIYESNWVGHDLLYVQAQNIEMLWQDFSHKLADQVLIPLNTYQSQFPEMRKKIDKRGRKLVDFDSQRHSYQSLLNNPKKRDDIKVTKAKESLEEAKRTYEILNSELHDELPALYDSRVLFLVTNLQTLFSAEQVFHGETAKVFSELEMIVDKLANDCQRGSYTLKKSSPKSPKSPSGNNKNKKSDTFKLVIATKHEALNWHAVPPMKNKHTSDEGCRVLSRFLSAALRHPQVGHQVEDDGRVACACESLVVACSCDCVCVSCVAADELSDTMAATDAAITPPPSSPTSSPPSILSNSQPDHDSPPPTPGETTPPKHPPPSQVNGNAKPAPVGSPNNNKHVEELYDIPVDNATDSACDDVFFILCTLWYRNASLVSCQLHYSRDTVGNKSVCKAMNDGQRACVAGATTDNLPSGVLYRVKATYKYTREDVDELSFDVGEIVQVVEYDDPEEQMDVPLAILKPTST
ncbi:hypothetical protein PR048_029605 [Dryococelus australis]|uniref:BAR domain-containing protein n=1 Tax=Dryococelus australis TaxID=614101 RepID=A0ABQ9GFY9_9NEOP|nr:hypothetical protein PR048_029605 [Dryococelus australis]